MFGQCQQQSANNNNDNRQQQQSKRDKVGIWKYLVVTLEWMRYIGYKDSPKKYIKYTHKVETHT